MEIRKVAFDADGLAENCPQDTIKTYEECKMCWHHIKCDNHTIYCSYQDRSQADED